MSTSVQAKTVTLLDLKLQFGLQFTDLEDFFREWQDELPELLDSEREVLDEVRKDYHHLSQYPMLEPIVKLVVLAPLLKLAGFYKFPFYLAAEQEVRLETEDSNFKVAGKLDLLIFKPDFWIMVVETKGVRYSVYEGIPQALTYMLGQPQGPFPCYVNISRSQPYDSSSFSPSLGHHLGETAR
jgi:hypothetical protein